VSHVTYVKVTWHVRESLWTKEPPPPPGGFPIYYVPLSRTVCKRTPLEECGTNPSRGVLLHTVLDKGTYQIGNHGGFFRSTYIWKSHISTGTKESSPHRHYVDTRWMSRVTHAQVMLHVRESLRYERVTSRQVPRTQVSTDITSTPGEWVVSHM